MNIMPFSQSQIEQANQTNLVVFLSARGEEFTRSGDEYRWKEHDSVTIKNNKWYQHSQSRGGKAVDFLMEFYGFSFTRAVEELINEKGVYPMSNDNYKEIDLPQVSQKKEFVLPPKCGTSENMKKYLSEIRGIDPFTVSVFESCGLIYEDAEHHNVVFVGTDNNDVPKYAALRGTTEKFRMDAAGSDKAYAFSIRKVDDDRVFVFEAPIDLMSFIDLYFGKKAYPNCVALGGVSPAALERFLKDNPNACRVFLCLDNDEAGNKACDSIAKQLGRQYSVTRISPTMKDWNDMLTEYRKNPETDITPEKKVLHRLEPVKMITMSDVETEEISWLWKPYIPFGKYSLLEGDSGLGKTTIAMQIIASCTTGNPLPGVEERLAPFNVIYQTAEDGLADTIRPRLENAKADLTRVKIIDDSENPLTLSDERIGRAIRENKAKLMILDPIQAYLGSGTDMNRANEVRPVLSKLGKVASETGCAILLIGHLNKNNSASAGQRGLGSIDIIAAARSVLLVGAQKDDFNTRAICHIKSSLAPAGPSIAFSLGTEDGFKWLGECETTPEDLASGKEIKTETKKQKAKDLIIRFLSEVDEMESDELMKKVTSYCIGERTYREAYSELSKAGKITYFKAKEKWFVELNEPLLSSDERASMQNN